MSVFTETFQVYNYYINIVFDLHFAFIKEIPDIKRKGNRTFLFFPESHNMTEQLNIVSAKLCVMCCKNCITTD